MSTNLLLSPVGGSEFNLGTYQAVVKLIITVKALVITRSFPSSSEPGDKYLSRSPRALGLGYHQDRGSHVASADAIIKRGGEAVTVSSGSCFYRGVQSDT